MKKIKYFLYTYILFLLFSSSVFAETTKNGIEIRPNDNGSDISVEVSCTYMAGENISFTRYDKNDINGEVNDGFITSKTDDYLKSKGFLNDSGYFDCPKYILWEIENDERVYIDVSNTIPANNQYFVLNETMSYCKGACKGEQYNTETSSNWTCDYKGTVSNKTLITNYDGLYFITFPDNITHEVDEMDISETCSDIIYNPYYGDKEYMLIDYNIKNIKNTDQAQKLYDFMCLDNNMMAEYYCVGNCKFSENKNITCADLKNIITDIKGNSQGNNQVTYDGDILKFCEDKDIRQSLKFIGNIILIAKIIVPILLIIMGSIDFGKAVVSSEADATTKAAKRLSIRIIAGVSIFLLPTIVNFIFGLIPIKAEFEECEQCIFHPNDCDVAKYE